MQHLSLPMQTVCRFDARLTVQQFSCADDLVLYSTSLSTPVRSGWPLFYGSRLTPRQLIRFLSQQNLHFPCFCSVHEGNPHAAQFTEIVETSPDERAFAYCHFNPPRCSYFLDLFRIYNNTSITLAYPLHTPIQQNSPYDVDLVVHYFTSGWATGHFNVNYRCFQPSFFSGFIDERNTLDVEGLTLTKVNKLKHMILQEGQLGPKHMVPKSVKSQSTQTLSDEGAPIYFVSDTEQAVIKTLGEGGGLSKEAYNKAFRTCRLCKGVFWERFLHQHIASCGRADGEPRKLRSAKGKA
ncbi:hypothetical protein C8R44DRAFT_735960 [Mycena epipterygia]|nr:hypothetical protein C8R44DRAFT_735960 [Mycena epipterygia]